ncbi:MAG: hypothetical protein K8R08_03820, partial [Methanosarcinales archaeon]|nr:hypothetical protein [Methanosarcinales archaeon]
VGSLSSARGAAGKHKKECGQEFAIHTTTFFPLAFPAPASAARCSRCLSKIVLSITYTRTYFPPIYMLLPSCKPVDSRTW